jgi:hypothetical protein
MAIALAIAFGFVCGYITGVLIMVLRADPPGLLAKHNDEFDLIFPADTDGHDDEAALILMFPNKQAGK